MFVNHPERFQRHQILAALLNLIALVHQAIHGIAPIEE
jgi:hypothetical protein